MKFNNKLKKQFKEGIITLAIAGITGLFAVANAHVEKYKETKAYYTESQCVVLTAEEINNIAFKEVASEINEHGQYPEYYNYIIYNNVRYNLDDFTINDCISYATDTEYIKFYVDNNSNTYGKFAMTDMLDNPIAITHNINWYYKPIVNYFKESTITLTPTQLNDTKYSYLSEQIEDNYTNQLANSVIEYGGIFFTFDEFSEDYILWAESNGLENITYNFTNKKFLYENTNGYNSFIDSITIFNASYIVDNINAPFETDDIIPAISGGLTLIGDLANQFLTGFTTLFWDSVGNKLTNFGIYSLTMLGVAITFAVIKLCLSVLRRDTGA